jgi:hypothetical protein
VKQHGATIALGARRWRVRVGIQAARFAARKNGPARLTSRWRRRLG